jgi:RNA polymerase sigma-70 factor (ECF subfamily)
MTEQEVTAIIKRAADGDPAAFQLIVSQNQAFLYSVAYRFLGNPQDAEDAVQEAFIKLWKNLPKYRHEIKMTTWLFRIVVNLCLDVLKSVHHKQQKNYIDLKDHISAQSQAADAELQAHELHKIIQEAASKLTPKQKAVFILRDLEELPVEEVCDILSMSAGRVKSNLYYARQQMSEKLKMYYQLNDKVISS